MNLSGSSLAAAARFFKLPTEQIAVVHDDVDLDPADPGAARRRPRRATTAFARSGQALGSAEFLRVRAGVGRPAAATAARSPTTSSARSRLRTTPRR